MLFTTASIAWLIFAFHSTENQQLYSEDNSRLQWETNHLDQRLELMRMGLTDLTGNRTILSQMFGDTYRVKPTDGDHEAVQNVVLVHLK